MLKKVASPDTSLPKRILEVTGHLQKLWPQDSKPITIQGLTGAPACCTPDSSHLPKTKQACWRDLAAVETVLQRRWGGEETVT